MVIVMSQHFLLSPAAKTLSLAKVMRMSDEEARDIFRMIRWAATEGEPVCPECGSLNACDLKSRPVWKCRDCSKQYSITSATIFHSRKLQVRDMLAAIALFTNGAKGYSALQMSRDLAVDYKTAFVLVHKLRESIALSRGEGTLEGEVEVDGANFGGYVKPANKRVDRKDRRKKINQNDKRMVVVALRQRGGETRAFVTSTEAHGVQLAHKHIKPNAVVHADEAPHWDRLAARFDIKRINHKEAYSADGACTNAAESYFSRLRRAEIGTHHHIAGRYLSANAIEMAWREDFRRAPNGAQFSMIVEAAAVAPKSRAWCGYWQRSS